MLPLKSEPTSLGDIEPVSEGQGKDPVLPDGSKAGYQDPGYTFYPPPREGLRAGQVGRWFFGQSLAATSASLVFSAGATKSTLRFGTFGATGATRWGPTVATTPGTRRVTGKLPAGPASGLAVQVVSGQIPSHQAVVDVDSHAYELDGALSAVLAPGAWYQRGTVDGQSLFVRTAAPKPWRAISSGGQPAPRVDVLSNSTNAESIRVKAGTPLAVVRDVAWDKGWGASVAVNGGPAQAIPVSTYGLVQQVHLPAGDDVVTFRYRPAHFVIASVLSLAAVLFLVVLGGVALVGAHRRRRRDATVP